MRDSIGGVVSIMFIGVFMLVVSAYLAFSVSYNKAFRVKNKIIKILEQHEAFDADTKTDIDDAMKDIGYNTNENLSIECDGYNYQCQNGYCVAWVEIKNDDLNSGYFKVVTSTAMNIPILNKISGINILTVEGDTITLQPDYKHNPSSDIKANCKQ